MFYWVMSNFERLKITVNNNRDTGNEILTRNYVFYHNFLHVHFHAQHNEHTLNYGDGARNQEAENFLSKKRKYIA